MMSFSGKLTELGSSSCFTKKINENAIIKDHHEGIKEYNLTEKKYVKVHSKEEPLKFILSLGENLFMVFYKYSNTLVFISHKKRNSISVPKIKEASCVHYETIGKSRFKIFIASI